MVVFFSQFFLAFYYVVIFSLFYSVSCFYCCFCYWFYYLFCAAKILLFFDTLVLFSSNLFLHLVHFFDQLLHRWQVKPVFRGQDGFVVFGQRGAHKGVSSIMRFCRATKENPFPISSINLAMWVMIACSRSFS